MNDLDVAGYVRRKLATVMDPSEIPPLTIDSYGIITVKSTELWVVQVVPMTYGKGRLVLGVPDCLCYDRAYCYETIPGAVFAGLRWDPETEPDPIGWLR